MIAGTGALAALASAQEPSADTLQVVVTEPVQITSNIPEGKEDDWLERAGHSVFVFFEDLELLNVEKEIDRFVGDPWTLRESTSLKLGLLPFHLRYPLYRTITQGVGQINAPTKLFPQLGVSGTDSTAAPVLVFNSGAGAEAAKTILDELGKFFTAEEIMDLGVYLLSKYSFFPQTTDEWNRLKRKIADFDVVLGLAAVIGGAAADAGSFSHSGKLFNSEKGGFRLGWYGSVRKLGFSFSPQLRAGLTAKTAKLEASAGASMQVNAKDTQEKLAIELALKYSLIQELSKPGGGWDLFLQASSRHVMTSGDKYAGKTDLGTFGLYGGLSEVFGVPQLGLTASAVIETDYRDTIGYLFNLALETENYNLQALLQFAAKQDLGTGQVSYHAGAYIGGSFESNTSILRSRMNLAGGRARDALESISRDKGRLRDAEDALSRIASGSLPRERERELVNRVRELVTDIEKSKMKLVSSLSEYYEYRQAYHRMLNSKTKLSDHFGLLDWDEVEAARAQSFDALGEYANLVRSQLGEIRRIRALQVGVARTQRELREAAKFAVNQTEIARKRLSMMSDATELEVAELNARLMDARTGLTRAYQAYAAMRSHARVIAKLDVGKKELWPDKLDRDEDSSARGLMVPL